MAANLSWVLADGRDLTTKTPRHNCCSVGPAARSGLQYFNLDSPHSPRIVARHHAFHRDTAAGTGSHVRPTANPGRTACRPDPPRSTGRRVFSSPPGPAQGEPELSL